MPPTPRPLAPKPLTIRAVKLVADGAEVEIAAAYPVEIRNLLMLRVEVVDGKAYVQQL